MFKTSKPTTHHLSPDEVNLLEKGACTHNVCSLGTSKDCNIQTPSKQNYTLGRVTKNAE